jgi:serine/threonine-protein kinase
VFVIELRTLGGLELRDSEGDTAPLAGASKHLALLAYLAVAQPAGQPRRDTLLAFFWPEQDREHARHALRQALYRIRGSLPDGVVVSRGEEEVALERTRFWCDVGAFEELVNAGRLKDALKLYRGDFLDGFHITGCPEFERWVDRERIKLRERATTAAWSLAEGAEEVGDRAAAAQWGHRAAVFAPDDEEALRRLIALLDRLGDRAQAAREYETFAARIRADYDIEPAPETRDLIATVLARVEVNCRVHDVGSAARSTPQEERDAVLTESGTVPQPQHPGRRRRAIALAATAVIVATVGALVANGRADRPALDPTRVLVDVFQNQTGDASLDHLGRMATDWITQGLSYTTFVDVVSLGTPLLSRQPITPDSNPPRDGSRLHTLAEANGTGTVVWGSYYRQGDSVHFQAHVTDARNREELASLAPVSGLVRAPVDGVERLRDRVMTTLATLTDPRLAKWARYASKPPTFEAYQEFVAGIELHTTELKPAEARQHFLRAAELDSTFTMPLLWVLLSRVYLSVGLRDSLFGILEGRRAQMAPLDGLFLDYHLARQRGDLPAALQSMRRVVELAPGSDYLKMAGNVALLVGRPREAVEFLTQADPESGWLRGWLPYWRDLVHAHHALGDHELELTAARRARGLYPSFFPILHWEMSALAALGRTAELRALIEEAVSFTTSGKWDSSGLANLGFFENPGGAMVRAAWELRAHGHGDREAVQLIDQAIEWYQTRPWYGGESAHGLTGRHLLNELLQFCRALIDVGRLREARKVAERHIDELRNYFPQLEPTPGVVAQLGRIAARQGNREEAERTLALLTERGDHYWAAGIAADLGDRIRAVKLYRRARSNVKLILPWWGLHANRMFESLWDYPPFQELIRPKG